MARQNYTIQVNPLEAGAIMGLIENLDLSERQALAGLRQQLIAIRKDIDKAIGVMKTFLPAGSKMKLANRLHFTNREDPEEIG